VSSPRRGKRGWIRLGLGIAISALLLTLILRKISWQEFVTAISHADVRLLPLALASLACGYAMRVARWGTMLKIKDPAIAWRQVARAFLVSIAFNNVLPLRAGDVYRLFAFGDRPALRPETVAGTMLIERLLDLMVLLAIFAATLLALPATPATHQILTLGLWVSLAAFVAAVAVFALPLAHRLIFVRLAALPAITKKPLLQKAFAIETQLAATIAEIGSWSNLARLTTLSLLVWVFEAGLYSVVLMAFHTGPIWLGGFFVMAVATLATLVPSSPGYVGTFHFFAVQAMAVCEIGQVTATTIAIAMHLLLWASTTLAGFAAFGWAVARGFVGPRVGRTN
jgi:uncharacterized protein (TIRG00374 family)